MNNYMRTIRQELSQVYVTHNDTMSGGSDNWTNHDCYATEDTVESINECQFFNV